MGHESQGFGEVVLPLLVPALAGVAVFLVVWRLLRQPLQGMIDRLFPEDDASRQLRQGVDAPLGPADEARDGLSAASHLATRREHHLAEWRRAEAEFSREPAEAVARAGRLLKDLARERGSVPVARALMREQRRRPAAVKRLTGFEGDAEFGAALADAAAGAFRLIRHARRGRWGNTAPEHQDVSAEDLRERMDLYRGALGHLLETERGEPDAPAAALPPPGVDARGRLDRPHRPADATSAERTAREWTSARWHMLQLVLSLAFGFVVLALVLWVLSM